MFSKVRSIANTTNAMIRDAIETITALSDSSAQVGQLTLFNISSFVSRIFLINLRIFFISVLVHGW